MLPAYRYKAVCARVVDGDTVQLDIDLGFHVSTGQMIRLHGVNAPEMRTPEGKAARAYMVQLLTPEGLPPAELVIESYRNEMSFARWVADLWIGEWSVAETLISAGHATRI